MTTTTATANESRPTLSDKRQQTVADLAARIKECDIAYEAARQRSYQADQELANAKYELTSACRLLRDVFLSEGIDEELLILITPEFEFSEGQPF